MLHGLQFNRIKLLRATISKKSPIILGHSINMWHFFANFRHPSPPCVIRWHCSVPHPLCVTWHLNLKKRYFKHSKIPKWSHTVLKKCHVTLWLTPSLPLVIFSDTVQYPHPQECHVLFKWPLLSFLGCLRAVQNLVGHMRPAGRVFETPGLRQRRRMG